MSLTVTTILFLTAVALELAIAWLQEREGLGTLLPPVDVKGILEEHYHPCEVDIAMRQECASLLEREFPNPPELPMWNRIDQKMRSMTTSQRRDFLRRLAEEAAHTMKVQIRGIRFEDIAGYGCYQAENDTIVISNAYLSMENEGVETVKTIFHELKHAVQYHAIATGGNVWGYPREVLIAWVNNYQHYIYPTKDPEGYFYQPLEIDAFGFENSLVPSSVPTFKFHVV